VQVLLVLVAKSKVGEAHKCIGHDDDNDAVLRQVLVGENGGSKGGIEGRNEDSPVRKRPLILVPSQYSLAQALS
jgi:hypothetical protein